MSTIEGLACRLEQLHISVCRRAPMAQYTTFQIGGEVPLLVDVRTADQLMSALREIRAVGFDYILLGRGSNVLFPDCVPPTTRTVIVRTVNMKQASVQGSVLRASCGALLTALSRTAQEHGLGGLAFAYGIPGTLGGALCMNAGAYGGEMSDVVRRVWCYDADCDERVVLTGEQMQFSYRHSILLSRPHLVALEAEMQLYPCDARELEACMQDYMARRRQKQPLEYPSAGSVFKRPDGHFAGALIEQSGLKGARIGDAMVSPKHAGFIVNVGGATADDVLALIEHIRTKVKADHGVTLETEIQIMTALYAK